MKFTLTYDGPLASNGDPRKKHAIRLALHPQLKELRQHRPYANNLDALAPAVVGGHRFTSIVHPHWQFRAELDILMLRPETPGGVIVRGDIDNRLKTLFDALTRPIQDQDIPKTWTPSADKDPLHCLLEDDSLITGVAVTTDRLLAARTASHVRLIIKVRVETTNQFGGLAMWG